MGHWWNIFAAKAEAIDNTPMRSRNGQFAPSYKERRRLSRFADVQGALAVYVATSTPAQRKAETEEYFTQARESGFNKAVRLGAWDGMKVKRHG
jgi:hypothetical protein